MKNLVITSILALSVALPSLASAANESLHSERAQKIFEIIDAEDN